MDLELEGKRALVTGGSRGIGKVIARILSSEGARVAIAARDEARLDSASTELSAEAGHDIPALSYEATDDRSTREMVASAAAALGGIDILVNNAAQPGGSARPTLASITTEDMTSDMSVKVGGYLRCSQQVVPLMAASGWGRIVNIGGRGAYLTGNMLSSMRIVAVAAMTKNLADELGPSGITVNLVHPGATRTERTAEENPPRPPRNVIGRIIESEEVAWLVAYLCSPKSASITGESISCAGGLPGSIWY
jgi:NAD(P)-dependent dehydrogenase (short-subunit alcohol dehydrogenase family)